MSILTTCIGAYPKPDFVRLPDWFTSEGGPDSANPTRLWQTAMEAIGESAGDIIRRGVGKAIADQIDCGIDIPTDGEIPRENYIHYHCRHLTGFDFQNLTNAPVRGGNYYASLPTITSAVSVRSSYAVNDWKVAQSCTDRPVKFTLPGPMTVADTNVNQFYPDDQTLGVDLATALNIEVRALAEAGCTHIQIDEPVFARQPENALDYGFENLERAFHGCGKSVVRTVHMCCGYPDRLDNPYYPKADQSAYHRIADAIEDSSINAISIEDAHRHNNLALLEAFSTTRVIFGAVAVAKSRVEGIDEIRGRLQQALDHIDADRLIAAPDCGLGLLGRDLAMAKLRNLCAAAKSL